MTIHETDDHFENEDASVRVSKKSGGWFFEKTDSLKVQVVISGGKRNLKAFVGIYGKPQGLRQLADLLNAVANVDQTQILDQNCPANEGMHTTLESGQDFPGSEVSVNIGRLDCKGDGTTSWLSSGDDVTWTEAAD